MVRARRVAPVVAAALLLTACGQSAVAPGAPEVPPYKGPLVVEVTAPPSDERADRSGAAGRVVDCDTPVTGDSRLSPYDGGSVSRSPAAALSEAVGEAHPGAEGGFREARREPGRVLYTYEAGGRTRQAYVVHRGPAVDGRTGWYVESWARCDWAEFPPAVAEGIGLQLWTDATGRPVATSRVVSGPGPEHCDWQRMTFLNLVGGDLERGQTYVAHPDPEYYPDYFRVAYVEGVPLPAGARDTGYQRDGRRLWVAADRSRAYVGTPAAVDVWPRTVQPLGCA
jgi:hypothetical protein